MEVFSNSLARIYSEFFTGSNVMFAQLLARAWRSTRCKMTLLASIYSITILHWYIRPYPVENTGSRPLSPI
ncbi:hypothetical protein CC79DRAFT_1144239 [Sarocladium strictum]